MNSIAEVGYTWFGTLVEAFITLTCEVANVVISSLNLTLNSSSLSDDASPSSATSDLEPTGSPLVSEKVLAGLPQFVQDLAAYFVFDDFQLVLLKIFIGILAGNVCLIYLAWHIYGDRISEFFMSDTPNIPPEELQRRITELDLPRVHSQRY